jgi:AcrR family transcriptional regulator
MARTKTRTESTKDALIRAAIRLLARRSAADISVRDIATAARVNHGLVHRHFGSKDALVREAVRRTSALVRGSQPEGGLTAWSFELLRERPEIARVAARCCLDGPRDLLALAAPSPEFLDSCVAPVRTALERLGLTGIVDPHVANAAGLAAILGWVVFRPLFDAGYRLPPDADERLAEIARLLDALVGGGPLPKRHGKRPAARARA